MKEARAHYRMPAGKWLGGILLLLFFGLVALVLKADQAYFGSVSPKRTVLLVLLDLTAMLILMVTIVQYRARRLWSRAHDGVLGTRLQSRIIVMFTAIAIIPTVIVASFSILFFNVGIKSWFDHQVSGALEGSVEVATAYVEERKEAIRTDALAVGAAIQANQIEAFANPLNLTQFLTTQINARNLSEAIVFDRQRVLARTALSFSLIFEQFPEEVLARADSGQVAVFSDNQDKIVGVVRISPVYGHYLMVSRVVAPNVVAHMQTARSTVSEYHRLQTDLATLQQQFFVVFILIALLILLTALWAGILLAVRLIEPLRALMAATEHVRGGDYAVRVPEGRSDDEIANLGRTFNRMTGQLESTRRDLIEANRLADERRRFTEAVLLGVSAGVIALDLNHRVNLHNRTALELLGHATSINGTEIARVLPGVEPLLREAEARPERVVSGQLVVDVGEKRVTLHVQVTAERFAEVIEKYIVTFDDITALVSAQRTAAWADVARRIAHEIKNPLTPITLSAERLRKKFRDAIGAQEQESFDKYLDTIARHTRDIGHMVEEFVAYARLPSSVFRTADLVLVVRKTIFSAQTSYPQVRFSSQISAPTLAFLCDEAQLGQALLNLLKNAAEALENAPEKQVTVTLDATASAITLTVEDTGPGFPADQMARLTEPYVTTRAKGTGLGLAIVKRSVEEHKGTLTLSNAEHGGARVTIQFPLVA